MVKYLKPSLKKRTQYSSICFSFISLPVTYSVNNFSEPTQSPARKTLVYKLYNYTQ